MINIQLLLKYRQEILTQAYKNGIKNIYVSIPLSPTSGQNFLFDLSTMATKEQIVEFRDFFEKIFDQGIIFLNKKTFTELMEFQSEEQRPAFQAVLDSAIKLEKLDMRSLEEQLEEQIHNNTKISKRSFMSL